MSEDMYVIVAANPGYAVVNPTEDSRCILTTQVRHAGLTEIQTSLANMPKRFGKCQIYKLVPIEEEEIEVGENCQHKEYTTKRTNKFTVFASCKKCDFAWVHSADEKKSECLHKNNRPMTSNLSGDIVGFICNDCGAILEKER